MTSISPMLTSLGWDPSWASLLQDVSSHGIPGRVVRAGRLLRVQLEQGLALVECPEHLPERPVCGDWVLVELHQDLRNEEPSRDAMAPVESPSAVLGDRTIASTEEPRTEDLRGRAIALLPRRNAITRRAVGFEGPQALAANVDEVWLVCSLDRSQGIRSLARYQSICRLDNVVVTVVLNKADLSEDLARDVAQANARAPGLDVVTVAALHAQGTEQLEQRLGVARTLVLLGPSGAGKSTLINALTGGAAQKTQGVREHDRRGRHTTSASQLFRTTTGALIIDSPGLRELGLWQSTGLNNTYADINELAQFCRFRDCKHDREPGCNVRLALEQGLLSSERFLEYLELARECATRAKLVKGRKRRYPTT